MLDKFLTAEEKVKLDKIRKKRNINGVTYFCSMLIAGMLYVPFCFVNIGIATIAIIVISIVFTKLYLRKKEEINQERNEFFDNVEANGEDSIYKKIKRHGTVYKGEVIHAKRKILVEQHEDYVEETVLYDFVIKFNEDGEEKYLVQRNFLGDVELTNEDKDEIEDLYTAEGAELEKFKENCINIYQYTDGFIYSYEMARDNMELDVYSDSILKNYVGEYFFPIYKYENLYSIGKIEGYKKKEEEKEEQTQETSNSKIGRIETILLIIIFIIVCNIINRY